MSKELREWLGSLNFYSYLIIIIGVVSSTKDEWWYLPSSCCGMGIFNLTTETTTATLNSFLQHYNTNTVLGVTLSVTLRNLQLELGVQDSPLIYDDDAWENFVTPSWIKSL